MLSDFLIRSTAALGGTPFCTFKCTALGSAGTGAASGAAVGGVPGALVGGALGLASSLLGGLFGRSNTDKTNKMNYQIMQEQNRFNAEEAKKNRDWQEMMYRMFGTSSAKASDTRRQVSMLCVVTYLLVVTLVVVLLLLLLNQLK